MWVDVISAISGECQECFLALIAHHCDVSEALSCLRLLTTTHTHSQTTSLFNANITAFRQSVILDLEICNIENLQTINGKSLSIIIIIIIMALWV